MATVLCQSKIRSSQESCTSHLKKKGKLVIQCDEMWSFVSCKGNKQWIWLAIDILTKEIVGVYIGKRDETGAIGLWDSKPISLSPMCCQLYRFLECLSNNFSEKKTQVSIQGYWQNELYRKI